MKHVLVKRVVFSPLLLGLAFAALAQTPAPAPTEPAAPPAVATSDSEPAQPASKDAVAKDAVTKDEVTDRNCLKETGSRLTPRPDSKSRKCINATGRAYTKDDLDSTGAIDLSDALRRLDPAVR